jgi:hypothetical protein
MDVDGSILLKMVIRKAGREGECGIQRVRIEFSVGIL